MSYDQTPRPERGTLSTPEAVTTKFESAGSGIPAGTEGVPIPANAIFHGECGKWWTGERRSHASCCHETFSSLTAFDRHRKGLRCNPPESVGLVARETRFGTVWGLPGPVGGYSALRADDDGDDGSEAA